MEEAIERAKEAIRNKEDFKIIHDEFQKAVNNNDRHVNLALLKRYLGIIYSTYGVEAYFRSWHPEQQAKFCEHWMVEITDELCKQRLINHVYTPVPSPDEQNMSLWESVNRIEFHLNWQRGL